MAASLMAVLLRFSFRTAVDLILKRFRHRMNHLKQMRAHLNPYQNECKAEVKNRHFPL